MLQAPVIIAASFLYLGLLFAIAYWADRRADAGRSVIAHPTVYALSLAVYCTTWTFYGSVGRAAASGVGFLPIYLGPTLAAVLWWFVMRKILRIVKSYRITSIADFVASRYGKSPVLAGLVTVIAVIGIVPYISLQLKAISNSFIILLHYPSTDMPAGAVQMPVLADSAFHIALLLAAFTILFGTRHLDATERHEGMVAAVAFESVVKLVVFLLLGVFVTFVIYDGFGDVFARAAASPELAPLLDFGAHPGNYGSWASLTVLSMFAVMFLPRQFQVAVVENVDEQHLKRAVWLFPLYLLLINIFVMPIALGGLLHFGHVGPDTDNFMLSADTFMLTLPMAHREEWLALLVYIGGLSAGTGMVIVETIALSTMICNDLVVPLLLHRRFDAMNRQRDLSALLLGIRRGAIVLVLLLGYVYFRAAGEAYALVGIGLISFAAVAQFAPAILIGLYWKGANRRGALWGLSGGFLVWAYTLLLPSFAKSGWLPDGFLDGLFGIALLRPQQLFGLTGLGEIPHSLFWSLLANVGLLVGVSLYTRAGVGETSQAELFVDVFRLAPGRRPALWRGSAKVQDLLPLLGRFLGPERARDAFARYARGRGVANVDTLEADAGLVHFAETQLAGAIGSASARVMVSSVVQEEPLGIDEVMNILDEASQVRAYSRQLEEKSRALESATAELRAANERLQELDRLKDDFMSSVTHELRTPLTSIRAFSELLADDPRMALEERKRFLDILVSETGRLTRLVNQILDMAKIESGNADWHDERLDLREVVEHAVAATSQLFREHRVTLQVHLPSHPCRLVADHDRLMQVMLNLLGNAVKFVQVGEGQVQVRLAAHGRTFRVEVEDNGPGIPRAQQVVIFEKFRQGGDAMTSKPQGTGLGLPISRQIVEHYGGKLEVDSDPPVRRGATFSFVLPAPEEPLQAAFAVQEEGRQ